MQWYYSISQLRVCQRVIFDLLLETTATLNLSLSDKLLTV